MSPSGDVATPRAGAPLLPVCPDPAPRLARLGSTLNAFCSSSSESG